MKKKIPSEAQEQTAFVKWFRLQYPKYTIFHIPNGGNRNIREAVKFKAMGVLRGVPDLYILELKTFIEMKTIKGKLSDSQIRFGKLAVESGHQFHVANGFDHAVKIIEDIDLSQNPVCLPPFDAPFF